MSLTLGMNIASLRAQRQLQKQGDELSSIFERLSSGQRINRASDDAAGLAISSSLRTDARVFNQARRNINDAVSAINIVDGTLTELSGIVTRQIELTQQARNGIYNNEQRQALEDEANALVDEYNRLVESAEFNGVALLSGANESLQIQTGYGVNSVVNVVLPTNVRPDKGTGTFTFAGTFDTLTNGNTIEKFDFNRDGKDDLVAVGQFNVSTYISNGDGTFTETLQSSGGGYTDIGDINNDGYEDLITYRSSGTFYTYFGNGDGTFQSALLHSTGMTNGTGLTLADLNNDGIQDVIQATAGGGSDEIYTYLGNGDGTFQTGISYSNLGDYTFMNSADLNGDGNQDVITISAGGASSIARVFLGNGDGTLQAWTQYTIGTSGARQADLVDANGDGELDLITGGNGYAAILLGNGDGSFQAALSYGSSGFVRSVDLIDINDDSYLDLVTGTSTGELEVRLGTGTLSFGEAQSTSLASNITEGVFGNFRDDSVFDFAYVDQIDDVVGLLESARVAGGKVDQLDFSVDWKIDLELTKLQERLETISLSRSTIGASQSILEVRSRLVQEQGELYLNAASRITDADIADESSKLTMQLILQQASAAVLAQANLQPSLALQLLRS